MLLLGLVAAHRLSASTAYVWAANAANASPASSSPDDRLDRLMERYQAASLGTLDWRPLETVPEDFYAM